MPASLELSPKLREYEQALKEWGVASLRPHARQADTNHRAPDNWRDILATCPVAISKIGAVDQAFLPGFDDGERLRAVVQYEAIPYADPWAHNKVGGGIGQIVVNLLGTPAQIQQWYDPIIGDPNVRTGFALTEPATGSDTSRITTRAVRDGDSWVINGSKMFCSHGASAQYVVVFALTDDNADSGAFVVQAGTPGFEVVKANEEKLGLRSWETSQLAFSDCRIPLYCRLGWDEHGTEVRGGRRGALATLNNNRPLVGAVSIGIGQAALDVTKELLWERRHGFRPDRRTLVDTDVNAMDAALDRARQMCRRAQWMAEQGVANRAEASMAKAIAPPTAERVVRRCLQLLGPDGASTELLIEKWHRDLKILDIFEGSGQIMRLIVARELARRAA